MALYSVEELLTPAQRGDAELRLTPDDAFAMCVFVMDTYPAVFDQAAVKLNVGATA